MVMEIPIFIVDAFSDVPFKGNPAAICLLNSDQEISDQVKQNIAAEMNLSETAFVSKLDPNDTFQTNSRFNLRWFTPTNEVDLCGHATVATSKVLFECCSNKSKKLTFESESAGTLYSSCLSDGSILLEFPCFKPSRADKWTEFAKIASCGYPIVDVQMSKPKKLLVRLADTVTRSEFEKIQPPTSKLHQMTNDGSIEGVILTIRGSKENKCVDEDGKVYDFVSRYFAPWNGIAEDPVCGSAHTVLAPYWADILGKKDLIARQCSARGGELILKVNGNIGVEIGGKAKVTLKGTFTL